eukprot:5417524-Lingulodinium_polyedra.AAC.1
MPPAHSLALPGGGLAGLAAAFAWRLLSSPATAPPQGSGAGAGAVISATWCEPRSCLQCLIHECLDLGGLHPTSLLVGFVA